MGKDFYENFSVAKNVFSYASEILKMDLPKLCFEDEEKKLEQTFFTQIAVFTTNLACWEVFKRQIEEIKVEAEALEITFLAGHSLGEYSALVASGSLKFQDGLQLVKRRGEIMKACSEEFPGKMAAIIGLEPAVVEQACQEAKCRGVVEPVNYNAPHQIVISGEKEAVMEAMKICKNKGGRGIPLRVSGGFHSSLMKPAGPQLAKELAKIEIFPFKIPVVANVTGEEIKKEEEVKELLIKQISSPVKWTKSIRYILEKGVNTFIEIGPGKVLSGLCAKISPAITCFQFEKLTDLETFSRQFSNTNEM
jgi:[acyl-carrier-protein] S-malonyltransferase